MITHPEKVLFPGDGITKGELAAYYEAVAEVMLPHICGRPLTMERYPQGIEGKSFFQKNVVRGFPEWLERIEVPKKDGTSHYPLVCDERSLLWVANQNSITPHVWSSRVPNLDVPDICVFDLDPADDDQPLLRATAVGLRDLLLEVGLSSWVKTTGSKGFHIVVPLDGSADFEVTWRFAQAVATLLIARDPDHLTQEFTKVDRGGRIFIDIGRNGQGATYAAPYAVRARPHAPVSAPCSWDEIEAGEVAPQTFTLRDMAARLDVVGDLWAGIHDQGRSVIEPLAQLEAQVPEGARFEDIVAAQAAARGAALRAGHARWVARGRTS